MTILTKIMLCIIFLSLCSCATPKVETTVYFKDGSQKVGLGLIKNNELKFKNDKEAKPEVFNFSLIDKVQMNAGRVLSTYVLMPIKDKENSIVLEEIVAGAVTLYQLQTQGYNPGFAAAGGNFGSAGSIGFAGGYSYNINNFYIKREAETAVTHLGSTQLFSKNFSKAASVYFADCPELAAKIEAKDLKKKDLKQIVEFYNNQCN
jgi:hypothetical protein